MRRFVEAPTAAGARTLAGWLWLYPNHGGVETVYHHAADGLAAWQSKSTNHVKPRQGTVLLSAWHRPSGLAWRMSPTPEESLGRSRGFAHLGADGRAVMLSTTSGGRDFAFGLGKLGARRFRVIHDDKGWRVGA